MAGAGVWQLTDEGRSRISTGEWLDADTYKIALFLSTSNIGAASTTYAGVTNEHANANGYTTGGKAVTVSRSGTGVLTITSTNPTAWTASGGPITARFAVLYEVGARVFAYCLLDSTPADVSAPDGQTFTLTQNASGIMTIT